jgi:hypothetical protein
MATEKQIAANRENARSSTGPRTEHGKRRSRRNAVRHGLTAETVIDVLEDSAAYKALQRAIYADYRPRTNFELELVARLVSLLWRLRRAVAIETGILTIQAEAIKRGCSVKRSNKLDVFYDLIQYSPTFAQPEFGQHDTQSNGSIMSEQSAASEVSSTSSSTIGRTFLRFAAADGQTFERLNRYETSLWRQTLQTVVLLNSINRDVDDGGPRNYRDQRKLRRRSHRLLWPPFIPNT